MSTKRKARPRKASPRHKAPRSVSVCGVEYPIVKGRIEIDGHRLGPKQVEEFKAAAQDRLQIAQAPNYYGPTERNPLGYARDLGLDDVLSRYKPSNVAERRILELSQALSHTAGAIASMRHFAFFESTARPAGCMALRRLIADVDIQLRQLQHFTESLLMQSGSKLQDWIERESEYQCIGPEVQP